MSHARVLQCVAVRCSVLQCVSISDLFCSVFQYLTFFGVLLVPNTLHHIAATHCITLQHTATHCNTLQYTATHRCNTRHHTVTHCNTQLQLTATHCNILQHTHVVNYVAGGDRSNLCRFLQHLCRCLQHTPCLRHTACLQHNACWWCCSRWQGMPYCPHPIGVPFCLLAP